MMRSKNSWCLWLCLVWFCAGCGGASSTNSVGAFRGTDSATAEDRKDFTTYERAIPTKQTDNSGSPTNSKNPDTNAGSYSDGGQGGAPLPGGVEPNGAPGETDDKSRAENPPPQSDGLFANKVQEADLHRLRGTTLFTLNTYRGLSIFDLRDARKPKKLSTLPVYGIPVEMFLEGDRAWVLVREVLRLHKEKDRFAFVRRNVSQLVLVDLADLAAPRVLQRVDIVGHLREGVSRRINDVLYVVSYTPKDYVQGWSYEHNAATAAAQATVYAFDISARDRVSSTGKLDLIEQATRLEDEDASSAKYAFTGVTITASTKRLLVAMNWERTRTDAGASCGLARKEITRLAIVELGTSGKPTLRTRFQVNGRLTDQFKQRWRQDPQTGKEIYLGLLQYGHWNPNTCRQDSVQRNALVAVDVTDAKNPQVLGEKDFTSAREVLHGSLFDMGRSLAYVSASGAQGNTLYVLDFSDTRNLRVASVLAGVASQYRVFRRLETAGAFLAVGRDTTGSCVQKSDTGVGTGVSASIFTVNGTQQLQRLGHACVRLGGTALTWRAMQWDLDQAHKRIGVHAENGLQLLSIPVSYQERQTQGDQELIVQKSAVGLMQWTPPVSAGASNGAGMLNNVSTILHPRGDVKRTVLANLPQAGKTRRVVLNLSDSHITVVGLDVLEKPETLAAIELAPYVERVYRIGEFLVEQVKTSPDATDYNEFRVKKLSANPNEAQVLASFRQGRLQAVLRKETTFVLFREKTQNGAKHTQLTLVDLSQPTTPRTRGSLMLPFSLNLDLRFYCGSFGKVHTIAKNTDAPQGNQWVLTEQGLATLLDTSNGQLLLLLDLRDLDHPTFRQVSLQGRQGLSLVSLSSRQFFLVNRQQISSTQDAGHTIFQYRYYAQPWYFQDRTWRSTAHINLPGRLVNAIQDGKRIRLLTLEPSDTYQVDGNGTVQLLRTWSLHLLALSKLGDQATLLTTQRFGGWQLRELLLDGQRLFVLAQRSANSASSQADTQSDHMMIYDLFTDRFVPRMNAALQTQGGQLMGIYQQRLFLNLSEQGVLALDLANPSNPKALHFERTLGWATNIVFQDDDAFVSSGHYGIYRLNLQTPSLPSTP